MARSPFIELIKDRGYEFLDVIPSTNLKLELDNNELSYALCIRLNIPLSLPYKCSKCHIDDNNMALHPLHCNRNLGRQSRHLKCNQIISLALRSAGFPTSMEPSGLFSDSRRPYGVTRIPFPWSQGKFLIWDFSCLDTNSPSNFNKDAVNRAQNFKVGNTALIPQITYSYPAFAP
ncbi:unnamed protein product [Gordionus sp. m RMFG-2023]